MPRPLRPAHRTRPRTGLALAVAAAALLVAAGCNTLELAGVHPPDVSLASTRIRSLSPAGVDLALGFAVANRNSVGVSFDRFDVRLSVAGEQLATGDQRRGLTIGPRQTSRVEVPLSVAWSDLTRVYRALRGGGPAGYQVDAGFWFQLPVLGDVRVPVTHRGDFPVLRLPELSLAGIDVERLTPSGADLGLRLQLANPNDFPVDVGSLSYSLDLAGGRVASSRGARQLRVDRGGTGTWTVPVSVDFLAAGRALYQALAAGGQVPYRLDGELEMSSSQEWIDATRVPFSGAGSVRLH